MKSGYMVKLVMPGLVPGIHVFAALKQEARGWPGRSPAMTWKGFNSIKICSSAYPTHLGRCRQMS
jgi:hypothetical protein